MNESIPKVNVGSEGEKKLRKHQVIVKADGYVK